jgi:hypothetical protein
LIDFLDLNQVKLITREHDRKSFTCGVIKLDNYLHDRSLVDAEKNVSRVFVLTLRKSPETIVGYYTLSSLSIPAQGLPPDVQKALPNYKIIGTTLLGRLAVAQNWQTGKCKLRLGEYLLMDAMHSAWLAAQRVASFALIVDVLVDEKGDPTNFYTKNGFKSFRDNPSRLFLPMMTIEGSLRKSGITLFVEPCIRCNSLINLGTKHLSFNEY